MQRARSAETTEGIGKLIDKLGKLGWYHSIELADGSVIPGIQTIGQLKERINRYPIPQDLRGKRVLDIGAWDGWFTFEMERRGASVVAVDSVRQEKFFEAKKLLNSKAEYIVEDVCHLSPRDIGYFDIVLFFGVLYHLKHPLLAIERVCELTKEMACIESLVIDDPAEPNAIPILEFYETTELAGQFDNWCGPNTNCLMAFLRTAGFVNSRFLGVFDYRAQTVGYRKWPQIPRAGDAPELVCVENTWTRDHTFRSTRDDYFTAWFQSPLSDLDIANTFVEVGDYATAPVGVRNIGGSGWQANCKLPLGLSRGWADVRIALDHGAWSNPARIAIDLSPAERRVQTRVSDSFAIAGVTDGATYESNRARIGISSSISMWVSGLPADAEKSSVAMRLDGTDLPAVFLSPPDDRGLRQINATLPPNLEPRDYSISFCLADTESKPARIQLYVP